LIQLKPKDDKKGEQLRSLDDYELDFSKLIDVANSDKVEKVKFYTEIKSVKSAFEGKPKLEEMKL
jgi:CRISPR-associated protein Csh2